MILLQKFEEKTAKNRQKRRRALRGEKFFDFFGRFLILLRKYCDIVVQNHNTSYCCTRFSKIYATLFESKTPEEDCPYRDTQETELCPDLPECPDEGCNWGEWNSWSSCSSDCSGVKTRTRLCGCDDVESDNVESDNVKSEPDRCGNPDDFQEIEEYLPECNTNKECWNDEYTIEYTVEYTEIEENSNSEYLDEIKNALKQGLHGSDLINGPNTTKTDSTNPAEDETLTGPVWIGLAHILIVLLILAFFGCRKFLVNRQKNKKIEETELKSEVI